MTSQYEKLGVDVRKRGVKTQDLDDLFPRAFCVIGLDRTNPRYGVILHTDGVGSKTVQRYLHFKEMGDVKVFKGDAIDILAMNLGDVYCVNGNPLYFTDYVARNSFNVPNEVITTEIDGFAEAREFLKRYGIRLSFLGGETADLAIQTPTIDVSATVYSRVKLSEAITSEEIAPGDVIIGLRSDGQASWENERNSGLMSNGLTLARYVLLLPDYGKKYPEVGVSIGKYRIDQYVDDLGMTVGEALISPTRMFAIPMKAMLRKYKKKKGVFSIFRRRGKNIHGFVHNTGGGQTKTLRIGNNVHYVKDNLPEPPPLFYLIQEESKGSITWDEMYRTFNMGIGIDVIVPPELERGIIETSESFGIKAQRIGYCEEGDGKNSLTIKSKFGEFHYPEEKAA